MPIYNVDKEQAEEFLNTLGSAALAICPKFGIDPEECARDAAEATTFGKFAIHNNYFNMPGDGDLGHNLFVRAVPCNEAGLRLDSTKVAKFSSPEAAVLEYCKRKTK